MRAGCALRRSTPAPHAQRSPAAHPAEDHDQRPCRPVPRPGRVGKAEHLATRHRSRARCLRCPILYQPCAHVQLHRDARSSEATSGHQRDDQTAVGEGLQPVSAHVSRSTPRATIAPPTPTATYSSDRQRPVVSTMSNVSAPKCPDDRAALNGRRFDRWHRPGRRRTSPSRQGSRCTTASRAGHRRRMATSAHEPPASGRQASTPPRPRAGARATALNFVESASPSARLPTASTARELPTRSTTADEEERRDHEVVQQSTAPSRRTIGSVAKTRPPYAAAWRDSPSRRADKDDREQTRPERHVLAGVRRIAPSVAAPSPGTDRSRRREGSRRGVDRSPTARSRPRPAAPTAARASRDRSTRPNRLAR